MTVLIGIALKSLLIAALTLGLLGLMKRRSASERSWIAHSGLFALVLMAVAPLALPYWTIEGPALLSPAVQAPQPTVSAADIAASKEAMVLKATKLPTVPANAVAAPAQPSLTPAATTMVLYAIPAAILLFITFLALVRLVTLRARADVLVDGHWLSALARAQRRMGFKHGTALLTSDELASPISWGLMRPVIVLNTRAVEAQDEAEAIIAHELAHVARMDWVKLLLARVATALFWFNPLVWLLAREAHQLREEAADDAVLGANIVDTDYAQLLVGVARHETPGLLLGAHGVAPSKSSLARRVARVLDGKIVRGPAASSFAAGVFVGAVVIAAPLAALTLVPNGTSAAKKAAIASNGKDAAFAPYYPDSAPTDLPTIISQGVSTSVQTAVAAINAGDDEDGDFAAVGPNGASVRSHNGVTVATGPSGATVTVYPADSRGRSKVVARGANGAVTTTYADADDVQNLYINPQKARRDAAIDQAIAMKAVGVTPEYLAAVRAAAPQLRSLSAEDAIGMKAVGVTPAYIRELAAAGYSRIDSEGLTSARAVGLSADYIRGLRAAGYGNLSLDDLTSMRAVGVTPSYIQELRRVGYNSLSPEKLVQLRALGVNLRELRTPPTPPTPPVPPAEDDDHD